MKSLKSLGARDIGLPLAADEILEFHAARVLLLLRFCGVSKKRIDGLTKLAKLDFFVRYPNFFEVARDAEAGVEAAEAKGSSDSRAVESAMVRHHYGPWDKRYYHVLAALEGRGLIKIAKKDRAYEVSLTPLGAERATLLASRDSFSQVAERMKEVKKIFGGKSGAYLKDLIYRLFDAEVGDREMGEVIE
jgi:hypothetical protein